MKKIAFLGVVPHLGGTYTVFLNLREGLLRQGIELRWMAAGKRHAWALETDYGQDGASMGQLIGIDEDDELKLAEELRDTLLNEYDGAVVNVLCDPLCTNLVRYLPADFPRMLIAHNITLGTYAAAAAIRDYVHGASGVSSRIAEDLIVKYGFNSNTTGSIPNSIDVDRFLIERIAGKGALRILVLSRIEDQSKGCFRIPRILKQLERKGIPYTCTVAGDGPDLEALKEKCSGLNVNFLGRVPEKEVPGLVLNHDAYLFPSSYEGFGISLVEAMAGGCVPVSAGLKGVTDKIVEDRVSGFLVAPSDIDGYVNALCTLAGNSELAAAMGAAARIKARNTYSLDAVALAYIERFHELENQAKATKMSILPVESWAYPAGLKKGWRSKLPEPVKNILRHLREKRASR